MNKFIGIGNLTKAPELHETEKGKVGKFTIAINGFNRTDYINITTFGAVAENCKKYLEKGKKVCACCKIRPERLRIRKQHGNNGVRK